jgi:hypothetical protein
VDADAHAETLIRQVRDGKVHQIAHELVRMGESGTELF